MEKSWFAELKDELSLPYMEELEEFVSLEREAYVVYPPKELVFSAFDYTPFDQVKVVIVGQDPYHGRGQAHGLSFSVPPGVKIPPSLKNIFKEIKEDLGVPLSSSGCLIPLAKQGVFLLNATLTVRDSEPKSHYGKGWERFTDAVIDKLIQREDPMVFLLWGKSAEEKGRRIDSSLHKVLIAAHPSPYSAKGFFGHHHFSKTNEFLLEFGKQPINWDISTC